MTMRPSHAFNRTRRYATSIANAGSGRPVNLVSLVPSLFRHSVLPGDFSRDETSRDVSRFQIKVAVDRADFAGDVEARDRFFHRIEHALFDVVLGPPWVLLTIGHASMT